MCAALSFAAVWLAGGVVVPLQPSMPATRKKQHLAVAKCTLVVTDTDAALAELSDPQWTVVVLRPDATFSPGSGASAGAGAGAGADDDDTTTAPTAAPDAAAPSGCPAGAPTSDTTAAAATSHDVAVILLTSGSTGTPLPVCLTHTALLAKMDTVAAPTGVLPWAADGSDAAIHRTSLTHIDGVTEVWTALSKGIRVVVVEEADRHNPAALFGALRSGAVTRLQTVPSMLRSCFAAYVPVVGALNELTSH